MSVYVKRPVTPETPHNRRNWSKLVGNWLKQTSFSQILVSVFHQKLAPVFEPGVLFGHINSIYAKTQI